ncbi:hypothetical protein ACLRDC_06110 [Gluconacetobacter sacchari]|uniref:S9 family peptidase n=2 Tax=Gluconacetobacter sacchari TaxID=92759 RepID=A0A7W4IER2_9PROT|nr:hypothetical protein [Gluconacetobacter sacchari]MBB2161402.1 hypothetical protein [Gluconacetobacter sacchari]GBQ20600.1 hypothetical protein AA12717_0626 [Gluconacetobacter sacchari DSM 12717]
MRDRALRILAVSLGLAAMSAPALAQEDDGPKGPTMHQLAARPPVPSARKDFSQFLYRPAGDKVIEQSDADRLLFWTPQGTPDGYAERRGNAIFYYDRGGHAVRVQVLPTPEN